MILATTELISSNGPSSINMIGWAMVAIGLSLFSWAFRWWLTGRTQRKAMEQQFNNERLQMVQEREWGTAIWPANAEWPQGSSPDFEINKPQTKDTPK